MFDFARDCTVGEVFLFWGIGRKTLMLGNNLNQFDMFENNLTIFTSRTFRQNYCYTHISMPSSRLCLSFSCNKYKLSDYYDHEYSCFSLLPWIFSPSLLQVVSRSTMSVDATSPHVIPQLPKDLGLFFGLLYARPCVKPSSIIGSMCPVIHWTDPSCCALEVLIGVKVGNGCGHEDLAGIFWKIVGIP